MSQAALMQRARAEAWSDEQVVERVLAGETELYEIIMRRHNQRLYRTARAILASETEAEDVMQEAYLKAYQNLRQFAGRASFATWLTRIAVNEALARRARSSRLQSIDAEPRSTDEQGRGAEAMSNRLVSQGADPERQLFDRELGRLLEGAIDSLPDLYRAVFVLREVEDLDTLETAECLGISEEAVKVRLHRARGMLRRTLFARAGAASAQAFQFRAERCDRVVANVFARINTLA